MVKVPEYQGYVADRPVTRQEVAPIRDVATPEAFGADIGRGMQTAARGVQQFTSAIEAVRQFDDTLKAKEADTAFSGWLRERMYGEGGFMTLEGRNAVDGRKAFDDEVEQKRREYGANLSPGAALVYQNASRARTDSALNKGIVHSANQRKQWFAETSTSRVQGFADDALAAYTNPAEVQKNVAAGVLELRQRASMEGWPAEKLKQTEESYISGIHKNVALRIAQLDPNAAQKYAKENDGSLSGKDKSDLGAVFAPLIIEENAKRLAAGGLEAINAAKANNNVVVHMNQGATRNQPITDSLSRRLTDAVASVYGPGYRAQVYSGGQPEAGGGRRVGSTRHDHGKASDVYIVDPNGKRLSGDDLAPIAQYWLARGYGGVGLEMRGGGIHLDEHTDRAASWNYLKQGGNYTAAQRAAVEEGLRGNLPSVLRSNSGGVAAAGGAGGSVSIMPAGGSVSTATRTMAFLDAIENPTLRDATAKRLNTLMQLQVKDEAERLQAMKANAFAVIDSGLSPDAIPAVERAKLGREEMSGLWSYYEARAKGNIRTDERTLYDLQTMFAEDPRTFAQLDLFKYRERLSNEDWTKVNGWRQTALTDERKAKDEGAKIGNAMSFAKTQLEAVGITTTGKSGAARDREAQRIAQFQMALSQEMEAFAKANENRQPTQADIQSMVNRLLLPAVIKQPGAWYGENDWAPDYMGGVHKWTDAPTRVFDAFTRPDATRVEIPLKVSDIPTTVRRGIQVDLARELGRKPSDEEVVSRYKQIALDLPGDQPPSWLGNAQALGGITR